MNVSEIAVLGVLIVALVIAVTLFVRLGLYRAAPTETPETEEPPAHPRHARLSMLRTGALPIILVCAFLTIYIAQLLGAASAVTLLGLDTAQPALRDTALVALALYTGAVLGIVFTSFFGPGIAKLFALGLDRRHLAGDLGRGVGWFLLITPMVLAVAMVSAQVATMVQGAPPDALGHSTLRQLGSGEGPAWAYWLIVAGVTIGAPIVEEVLYRGCLQSAVRRFLPAWGAIVATSVLFTLIHFGSADPRTMPGLFVLALGMGLVYERTGRLLPCIVVHALFNAMNVAVAALSVGASA